MTRSLVFLCVVGGITFGTSRAEAQGVPLSQLLPNLIQAEIRLEPPPPGFVSHEAHFLPGLNQDLAPFLFNQQLVAQLATVPTGTPSGGFAFTFDPATGAFQRATNSFGPSFADRALTNGRGKFTLGANFQYSKYTSFEDADIQDGEVKFYLTHEDLPGDLFFEGDLIEAALRLDLSSSTTTIFANYGVTNAFDVAVSVPILSVKMDAAIDARILRLATGQATTNIHSFAGGRDTESFSESGSATGIGDLLVRAKYRFFSGSGGGLAAGVDLRLPTGDADELLGTGATGATFLLIGSSSSGVFAPHFNVSYTASGESDVVNIANEFGYKAGTEIVASPKVTFTADFLGRTLIDAGRLELTDVTHTFRSSAGVPGSITLSEYIARDASLNLSNLAVGGKFNVGANLLISANALIALSTSGVTARITPVFGFDYTF
jgi:Putative MetA-pathway of phenol degradation